MTVTDTAQPWTLRRVSFHTAKAAVEIAEKAALDLISLIDEIGLSLTTEQINRLFMGQRDATYDAVIAYREKNNER